VRLPPAEADKLDRASFELKRSKQDLVTALVSDHLDAVQAASAAPRRVTVELPEEGVTVGRHAFHPAEAREVLSAAEAADLLRTTVDAVTDLAATGELPGRQVLGEWRFSRAAVLAWLGHA